MDQVKSPRSKQNELHLFDSSVDLIVLEQIRQELHMKEKPL